MDNFQDIQSDLSAHQAAVADQPHDSHGHFAPKPQEPTPPSPNTPIPTTPSQNPISHFLHDHSNGKDDLLDIHVGNPLHKITLLLEEIKKQKAFSFTLKGSLGVMGVVLALSVFGILGAGNLLCDKGEQTQIGTIKILHIEDTDSSTVPFIGYLLDNFIPKTIHMRTVLIREDNSVIRLPYVKAVDFTKFFNNPVLVTGNYDSCSQTLTVKDKNGVEEYTR